MADILIIPTLIRLASTQIKRPQKPERTQTLQRHVPNANMSTSTTTAQSAPFPANTIPSVRRVNVVPAMAPPHKFIEGSKGQDFVWDSSNIARRDLLFVRETSSGTITINTPIAKVLIECCQDLVINLPDKIMTNMIEIWKCKNVTINLSHPVLTAQVDMCENVTINYASTKDYQQVVWSNSNRLEVNFKDGSEHNTVTGLAQMKAIYDDVQDTTDQFFLRFLKGVLTPEILIRLPGGFPTTAREADEWEAEHPHDIKIF